MIELAIGGGLMGGHAQSTDSQSGQRFAERFELHEPLGKGGMAVVYRATDRSTGQTVALKQLTPPERDEQRGHVELLFEREFHTLSQLSHPHVIAVYDYGVTPDGICYYTMELLDGGAIRERAPLPWREACRLLFDVCSSLALLHSRRLLHRDVSPRNVHCTRDGHAKLIDFGAVTPMSADGGDLAVGTPAFTAPETVHRSATDGRTDLYSLGATLYYVLTGRLAYPARTFAELLAAWSTPPAPPSTHVKDIPAALDDLVISLLDLSPALRPQSAFVVMQRLAAIAGLESREADSVSRAYLATPALAGRQALLAKARDQMVRALATGARGLLLRGGPGMGRSRLLDAIAIEAKTLGARVLRANARGTPADFEVALALAEHLVLSMPGNDLAHQVPQLFSETNVAAEPPRLRDRAALCADREELVRSLVQLMRAASKLQPLVFAVDDVHRIDEPSAAVLATLIDRFRYGRAFAVMTVASESGSSQAIDALARRCEQLDLKPLSREDTRALFASVFGDVPNLGRLAEQLFELARGNPRASLDIAQHLIERGLIAYGAGAWVLPSTLSQRELPQSLEAANRERIEQLDPLARSLAQAHALAFVEQLTHEDYRGLARDVDTHAVEAAVSELLARQILRSNGVRYEVANEALRSALLGALDETGVARAHAALATVFEPKLKLAWIHHVLAGGGAGAEAAVDALRDDHASSQAAKTLDEDMHRDAGKLAASYARAIDVARRLGRPVRHIAELQNGLAAAAVAAGNPALYWTVAPSWAERLIYDTGLDLWRHDHANADAGARLTDALTQAFERYNALPEHARGYRPDEALARMGEYVALSIAVGIRTMDVPLIRTLPELLEPFAPLSPLLSALWSNAIGCVQCHDFCHYEAAREGWIRTYEALRALPDDVPHVLTIRGAIAYAIGMIEAVFGLASAAQWADSLDHDPYQRVSAMYLRKIVRLEQGDWPGAEKLQRSAELLALRARVPQMFVSSLTVEISAHALALDLAGVQDVIQRERVEAAVYPGWIPYVREAEARFELIRGDLQRAKDCFDDTIAMTAVDANLRSPALPVWVAAQSGLCEVLIGLGRLEEARDSALAALGVCEKLEIQTFSNDIRRVLALAEAKLGDFPTAAARLDRMIAAQNALGVTGLRMGLSYEARAEVALWSGDARAFETCAALTAREYRHGAGCPLSARYERLTREARSRGFRPLVALSDFEPTTTADSSLGSLTDLQSVVRDALASTPNENERYERAVRLACGYRAATGGHLYLATAAGPRLVASVSRPMPGRRLEESVREYLEEQADRFETQTVAAPELASAASAAPSTLVDGVEYELALLTYDHREDPKILGVLALVLGRDSRRDAREPLLLASIAEQLAAASPKR